MTVDRRFERAVLAELALSEQRRRRHEQSHATASVPTVAGLSTEEVAAIEDRLGGARPEAETLAALRLLPDPRLTK